MTPERALRLAEELRGSYPAELVAAALTQQSLRMAAREKFSRAEDMFFTRAGLEQASAEMVARHSARRFRGLPLVADLCCGIGGDLVALAASAGRVLAVDADSRRLRFARRNVAVQGPTAAVEFVCADVCADVRACAVTGSLRPRSSTRPAGRAARLRAGRASRRSTGASAGWPGAAGRHQGGARPAARAGAGGLGDGVRRRRPRR